MTLEELLQTVRFKRTNGTILEASDVDAIRQCCAEVRMENSALVSLRVGFNYFSD